MIRLVKLLIVMLLVAAPMSIMGQEQKKDDESSLRESLTKGINSISSTGVGEKNSIKSGGSSGKSVMSEKSARRGRRVAMFEGGLTAVVGDSFIKYTSGANKGRSRVAFGAGLYGQFSYRWFGFRPEVLYERDGMKHDVGNIWINSVVVPFNVYIQTKRSSTIGAYVSFGGYYRHTFSGEVGGESIDFAVDLYKNDAGVEWGFGVWFSHFTLGATFRYGLTDVNRVGTPDMRYRSNYLKLGYRF